MLYDPIRCLLLGILRHGIRFWINFALNLHIRPIVHEVTGLQSLDLKREAAVSHLRGQVVGVGVEVTLGASVDATRLHGVEPLADDGVVRAEVVGFVVEEGGVHSFYVRSKNYIRSSKLFKEIWTWSTTNRFFNLFSNLSEILLVSLIIFLTPRWPTKPLAPCRKQFSLKPSILPHLWILHRLPIKCSKSLLQFHQYNITFGYYLAINGNSWQIPRGHYLFVPVLFGPITEHGDLLDPVWDLVLLEPEPHLLAVGAPGMVVTVESHSNILLGLSKESKARLSVGGAVREIDGKVATV